MDTLMMLAQTLVALAIVCALAYVVLRWVLPRLQIAGASQSRLIKIVDLVALDANRKVYLLEMAGRWMLISSSEAGVHLIKEFEVDPTAAAVEEEGARETAAATKHDPAATTARPLSSLSSLSSSSRPAAAPKRPPAAAAAPSASPASWAQQLAERFVNNKRG